MYDEYYQEYCNEVHLTLGTYLFWKMIQNRAASEPELLSGLNEAPTSWIFIRHSLQVTMFLTLGRIFDANGDAFSADDLLKCCIREIDIFSKGKLRERKLKGKNGNIPDWIDEYIGNSYVPVEDDFQRLRGELTKRSKIFQKVYRPIRHKIFAHKDKKFIGKTDELWSETNIGELEEIIWFLNDLKRTLFETYENGRKPILQESKPDTNFYESDFKVLLDTVKGT